MLNEFRRRADERKAWEAANPETARIWSEALLEDHRRTTERDAAARHENAHARALLTLRALKVPLDAIDALAHPKNNKPLQAAKEFVAAPATTARFLLLLGQKGVGKTVAAAFVLRELVAKGANHSEPSGGMARKASAAEFTLASSLARISGYNHDDREWFERLCETRVLVIDDLGADAANQFSAAMLDELLTRRHAERLRTVITSNLGKDAIKARLGDRLTDRIRETGIVCVTVGDSLRVSP